VSRSSNKRNPMTIPTIPGALMMSPPMINGWGARAPRLVSVRDNCLSSALSRRLALRSLYSSQQRRFRAVRQWRKRSWGALLSFAAAPLAIVLARALRLQTRTARSAVETSAGDEEQPAALPEHEHGS
jgi:hypothetical protein